MTDFTSGYTRLSQGEADCMDGIMMKRNQCCRITKLQALIVISVIWLAVVCLLVVGLGYVNKSNSTGQSQCLTSGPQHKPNLSPPLYVKPSTSKQGVYRFAAVAADNAECSKIGNYIMAVDGGSAVDAAIAAILCVGVHNMHSSGIGGGHFLTIYNKATGEVHTVNAREQAPSRAHEYMFTPDKGISPQFGGLSIGIPGEIRGLWEAYQLGGRLPWKHLFQPTIKLCRNGITVTDELVFGMSNNTEFFDEFPDFKQLITNPTTGQIYQAGEIIYLPKLALTLEIIADRGPAAFYTGSLAEDIVDDITDAGGIITETDLANYTALVRPPLVHVLRNGLTVYSPPLPSSGVVYQFILNVLDGYHFNNESMSNLDSAIITWHRITEAFKQAYGLRTHLGDIDVGDDEFRSYIHELVSNMTDRTFGDMRRQMIRDDATFGFEYYNPSLTNTWDHGTSHLSVLGPNGDAVSITSTINVHFGSKVIGSRTGIIFNDVMDDFSTPNLTNVFGVPSSPANSIQPWKRPLSSMTPSIVVGTDGHVALVVGSSGGTRITSSTALVTMETLLFGWDIKEAIDYPRIHHQLFPQYIRVQESFPEALADGLRNIGHNITFADSAECYVQGILRFHGNISANCDYRKGGAPDGY